MLEETRKKSETLKGHVPYNKGTAKKKSCEYCGRVYKVREGTRFCSWNCYKQYRKANKPSNFKGYSNCFTCNKLILSYRKFCSFRCYGESLRGPRIVKRDCPICHQLFQVGSHNKAQRFCSHKCYSVYLRGKHLGINTEFQKGQKHSQNFLAARIKSCHKRPTKLERKMISIIRRNSLPFNYTGDGSLIIGSRNPDFVHLRQKIVLEVFGRYWHDLKKNPNVSQNATADNRISYFKTYGYQCLIIWEEEIKNEEKVVQKLYL